MSDFLFSFLSADSCSGVLQGSTGSESLEVAAFVTNKESLQVSCEIRPVVQNVEKVFKDTQHYNLSGDSLKKIIVKSDDSDAVGEHHAIDTKKWTEIDNKVIDENRIWVGREYSEKEAIIFIQVGNEGRTEKCKNYELFNKKDWVEYRKERGENKHKKTRISVNGVVCVGETNGVYKYRVFVKREKTK